MLVIPLLFLSTNPLPSNLSKILVTFAFPNLVFSINSAWNIALFFWTNSNIFFSSGFNSRVLISFLGNFFYIVLVLIIILSLGFEKIKINPTIISKATTPREIYVCLSIDLFIGQLNSSIEQDPALISFKAELYKKIIMIIKIESRKSKNPIFLFSISFLWNLDLKNLLNFQWN